MIAGSHPSNSRCNHMLLEGGGSPKGLAALGWGLGQPDPQASWVAWATCPFQKQIQGFWNAFSKFAVSVFQKFKLNLFWSVSRPIQLCIFPDSVVLFLCCFCAFF